MKHESNERSVVVQNNSVTFDQVYDKAYIPREYEDDIRKANLLILPEESFREEEGLFFPETTREFFEYMKASEAPELITDIAVSDEDFQKIELHASIIEVATIIIKDYVFPVVLNLVSSFLYDLVKKYHRSPDDTSADVKIIVEETKRKKSKKIIYKGPVSGVKDTLEKVAEHLFDEE